MSNNKYKKIKIQIQNKHQKFKMKLKSLILMIIQKMMKKIKNNNFDA